MTGIETITSGTPNNTLTKTPGRVSNVAHLPIPYKLTIMCLQQLDNKNYLILELHHGNYSSC